jgi:D-alanine-D-alanine ligase
MSNSDAGASPRPSARSPHRTLGPISDLEKHLPADWWRSLFNAVYLKTDGDVVENAANTAADIDLVIRASGIEKNDRIVDLCCGQGRHTLELARRGYRNLTGFDRSRYLVRLARRRAQNENLPVTFREADARKFRYEEGAADAVLVMGNSFGYFEREEDDTAVLTAIRRALRSRGTLVMDIADGEWIAAHYEQRSWEWIDQNQFVCRERTLSSDGGRLITREVVVHAEKGVIADQFYAERLYSQETITRLLADAGFGDIRIHDTVVSQSERNQDLGMMARRIFLTAEGPVRPTQAIIESVPLPDVTVLLGDPRLPDTVKLGGQFNPEDLATVQKLKDALGELEGFRFSYHDNHQAFLTAMRNEPPTFVLNLCDEGYDNDALMELHVPAYLEMLGIPYTGAGPSCLGLCYDKSLVRAVADAVDVPVPAETYVAIDDSSGTLPSVFPALIKPAKGDSSIGITQHAVVRTPEEAIAYLDTLRETVPDRDALIQEYLEGNEYTVGLIGNPGFGLRPLPVLEVDYSRLPAGLPKILSYESKWDPESPYWTSIGYREADIPEDLRRNLIDWSIRLFDRLGCRDYARFDFRCGADGVPRLLEVNPNPGWCWDGKMNLMAEMEGLRYADLLRLILEAAQARVASGVRAATVAA